jgi:para-aminobenzoate synthetase component 1
MAQALPNLGALARSESHFALLFDGSDDGVCYLGIGAKRVLEVGGDLEELDLLESLENFTKGWTFGWIGYDVKNSILEVNTREKNGLGLPDLAWWEPEVVIRWSGDKSPEVIQGSAHDKIAIEALQLLKEDHTGENDKVGEMVWSWKKDEYLEQYNKVQDLIQAGDVYELNLCQTLQGHAPSHSSWNLFASLYEKTKAPFSAYMQCGSYRVMSCSPERFIKKEGSTLISQPIKGTIARGLNDEEDLRLIDELRNSEKERAENIMITDLVRNDLSRVAKRGSVVVNDLCGIHTFETVHQMISEVACEVDESKGIAEILRATFPMGSMTGAPKISAMKHIDKLEQKGRGVYSGSVGYITPEGNFDLNVLIRSLFHNAESGKLEASVGGAITSLSEGEMEFDECKLKASAILNTVK